MSPAGPVHVGAPGKALISWENHEIEKRTHRLRQVDVRETPHMNKYGNTISLIWVVLDSPVRSTLFTLDRQNSYQVSENSCAEAVPSTLPSEVVWSEYRDHVMKQKWLNGIKTSTNISFKTRNSYRNSASIAIICFESLSDSELLL